MDILICWNEYNNRHRPRIENRMIWLNEDIKINNNVIMWRDVYKNGLKYVHELFHDQQYKTYQMVKEQYNLDT